ncbi:lamin Dm0-like [Musca autumnalis]|uniref:lamin Dm0-like n=1 Tax=Musca autumnalis TaxID=221902 RepID=UPI003CEEE4CD
MPVMINCDSICLNQSRGSERQNGGAFTATRETSIVDDVFVEFDGKEQKYSQEINEIRYRRGTELSEMDCRLSKRYEETLQQSLRELREQHERQFRAKCYEMEMKHNASEELRATRTRIGSLNNRISEIESANATLDGRNCHLEKLLANERALAVYYKSLCDEEDMSQTSREKDHIEISKSDPQVILLKKGTKEVHIGGCHFKLNADDKENNVNFHRSEKIEGDVKKLIVNATYNPPIKMVMKSQKIQGGDSKDSSLFNGNEEVAVAVLM